MCTFCCIFLYWEYFAFLQNVCFSGNTILREIHFPKLFPFDMLGARYGLPPTIMTISWGSGQVNFSFRQNSLKIKFFKFQKLTVLPGPKSVLKNIFWQHHFLNRYNKDGGCWWYVWFLDIVLYVTAVTCSFEGIFQLF